MDPVRQPLRFHPVCTGTDGSLLSAFAGDGGYTVPGGTTTCWHLIDAEDVQSIVADGDLEGRSLRDLVARDPGGVVGRGHREKARFPVCLRLLETTANTALSVFPQSTMSVEEEVHGRNQRFWYSIASTPGAWVCAGIGMTATRLSIMSRINSAEMQEAVRLFQPAEGDAFFIPGGCLHALGAGNLVWDVSESPAAPLRVSGWGGDDSVPAAETARAAPAIFFQDRQLRRIPREARKIEHTRRVPLLGICPQFNVDQIHLCDHFFDRTNGTTFHALLIKSGRVRLEVGDSGNELLSGQFTLIPASLGDYRLYCVGGPATVLRVFLQR